jgi:hypothetical protein
VHLKINTKINQTVNEKMKTNNEPKSFYLKYWKGKKKFQKKEDS